jgi:hypothetical protein
MKNQGHIFGVCTAALYGVLVMVLAQNTNRFAGVADRAAGDFFKGEPAGIKKS